MNCESRQSAKLVKGLGLIIFWMLGIIPFLLILVVGVVLVTPYVSFVATLAGAYIYNYSRALKNFGEIDDR